jgi:hypothetical protein
MGQAPRILGPAAAAVAVHLLLMGLWLGRAGGDPSSFLCAGANHVGRPPYEAVTWAGGPAGHDGQFYYALARAPLGRHDADIDHPPLRQVRLLYPAVCWALTGGHPRLLLYVMPAVNLLAVAALAGLGARVALAHGRSPWLGLLLPLGANVGISLVHNFTDCLACLAVSGLLWAWVRGAPAAAVTAWAAAALFSREQNLLVVAPLVPAALAAGRRRAAAGVALACLAWAGWVALLWSAYGRLPLARGGQNLTAPFGGAAGLLRHLGDTGLRRSCRLALLQGLSLAHLALLLAAGVVAAGWPVSRFVRLVLAAGVALAVLGGPGIYADFSSYLRVFAWAPLGLWFCGVATGRSWPLWLLAPGLLWSLAAALRYA